VCVLQRGYGRYRRCIDHIRQGFESFVPSSEQIVYFDGTERVSQRVQRRERQGQQVAGWNFVHPSCALGAVVGVYRLFEAYHS
jgi:hypothetical protein